MHATPPTQYGQNVDMLAIWLLCRVSANFGEELEDVEFNKRSKCVKITTLERNRNSLQHKLR